MSEALKARGRLNALRRCRPADDPVVVEAQTTLKSIRAEDYVRELVDTFPPLTAEQRDRIAALLVAG